MEKSENFIPIFLAIIGSLITLIIPIPLEDEYRLFIISSIIFIFLLILLTRFDKRLENKEDLVINLNKRFKNLEELNDIRLNIKELQKEVFKK